jgi:hemerythrin
MKEIGIASLDHHHKDVFEMIQKLDQAIQQNTRQSFEPIIQFLEDHCTAHFDEEEALMKSHNFKHLDEHQKEHHLFKHKIKSIRKMYNENIHTTHVAYSIRLLIDKLITHIQVIDVKIKDIHD